MNSNFMINPYHIHSTNNSWIECLSNDGSTFYFNKLTNLTTWEKPNELKSEEEILSNWSIQKGPGGKIYYYNKTISKSVWEEPEELKNQRELVKSRKKTDEIIIKHESFKNTNSNEDNLDLVENNEKDNNEYFKGLIKTTGIAITWKFDDIERVLKNNDDWKTLKYQHKKQLFNEIIKELKEKEKEELRFKKDKAKMNFYNFLLEDSTITSESDFRKYCIKYARDEKWLCLDAKSREEEFENYLDELYKKEQEEKEIILQTKLENYKSYLKENIKSARVTWNDYCPNNVSIFEKYEKLKLFSSYIANLFSEEIKTKNSDESEFKSREEFRKIIIEDVEKSKIDAKTDFISYSQEIIKKYQDNINSSTKALKYKIFYEILSQGISVAEDIFEEILYPLKDQFEKGKEIVKNYLKSNLKLITDDNLNNIYSKLVETSDIKFYFKSNIDLLYDYLAKKHSEKKHNKNEGYNSKNKALIKLKSYFLKKNLIDKKLSNEELIKEVNATHKFSILSDSEILQKYNEVTNSNSNKHEESNEEINKINNHDSKDENLDTNESNNDSLSENIVSIRNNKKNLNDDRFIDTTLLQRKQIKSRHIKYPNKDNN